MRKHLIEVTGASYWKHFIGQTVVVRIEGVDSEPGIIGRGVRQGCSLSSLLFNIYIQSFVDEALEKIEDGVNIGGHLVNTVRFADDQTMVANSKAGLQRIMIAQKKQQKNME